MSIQETINSLKSLSTIDAKIAALEVELTQERAGIDDKSSLKDGLDAKISRLTESVSAMETTRNELVSETRQTSLQLDRSREKMMRCRNEREANAVQRELEELRRVFRERDHEAQKLSGLIDQARADLDGAGAERDAISNQLDATEGDSTARIRELEAALAQQKEERAEAAKKNEGSLLRRYEVVRQRRGSGLAVVKDGTCVACHISLPPMLYQRILQQAELYQCPSCQRVLYPIALDGDGSEEGGSDDESPDDTESQN